MSFIAREHRRYMLSVLLGAAAALLFTLPAGAEALVATKTYVVVIANNRSLDPDFEPLLYADDDGAKYYELFQAAGAQVSLLAVLDPDAQERFPDAAANSRAPSKKNVLSSVGDFFERMEEDSARGIETHFVFVYSGHGNIGPNREGYLNLLDYKFGRSDLYEEVISRSPATFNHIILDACNSYYIINKRGGKSHRRGDYTSSVRDFLKKEDLAMYPNTGVILAASRESETHEWSRWESGVFSHELRSAMLGSADVNGDGAITYAEAAACVQAANAAIDVPKARINVYYTPPAQDVDAPLMRMSSINAQARLNLDRSTAGRYHVEDARGVRIADFHFSEEQPIKVALVGRAPFFLRTFDREAGIEEGETPIQVASLEFASWSAASKGSVERSFRKNLYAIPFGLGFFQGNTAGRDEEPGLILPDVQLDVAVQPSRRMRGWAWTAMATGVAAGIAGGFTYYSSSMSYEDYEKARTPEDAANYRSITENRRKSALVLFGAGSALVVTGTVLFIVDAAQRKKKPVSPAVSLSPGGLFLGVNGIW